MAKLTLFAIAAPSAGLNKRHPGTMIQDEATPDAKNVRVDAGVVFKRIGYTTLTSASVASGVPAGVTSGPYRFGDFSRLSGSVTAMLATISSLYKWGGSSWSSIKSGLNGAADGYHSATVMNDTWIYTNGVDHVQVWTGTGNASDLAGGDDYQTPTYHLCRGVIAFADRLLLLGTNEDGTWLPYRVRWSELGKTNEFKLAEGGGASDLVEDPTGIRGAELLGNWCIIYCGASIWQCIYVGGTVIYAFNRVIPNKGTHAPRSIQSIGQEHIFMGEDDVYRFNGSSILSAGEAIRDELFGGVSRANRMRCFSVVDEEKHLYYLGVPYGSSGGHTTRAYIYNYEAGTWTIDTWPGISCAAMLQLGARLTIDDFPHDLTIDDFPHDKTIDDFGGQENKRHMVLGHEDGYIYEDDGFHLSDNGTAVASYWCSKDMVLDATYVHRHKRIQEILFEARGSTLKVEYSTDMGDTWATASASVTLADQYARYMVPIDVTARAIRVRFTNDVLNERFWLRWLGVRFMVESER